MQCMIVIMIKTSGRHLVRNQQIFKVWYQIELTEVVFGSIWTQFINKGVIVSIYCDAFVASYACWTDL